MAINIAHGVIYPCNSYRLSVNYKNMITGQHQATPPGQREEDYSGHLIQCSHQR